MPHRPFRFLHASDFHLEMPLGGLAEVPDHLREPLVDSPLRAARRVFDAALAEEVEFLVLSGDILHPQRAGLQGPLFLVEQFSRLAAAGIAVYWAGGPIDPPEAWPAAFPLPNGVQQFPTGRVAEIVFSRDGQPLARLCGTSHNGSAAPPPAAFQPDPAGLFSLAVFHGAADAASLQSQAIDYWALGGQHDRTTLFSASHVAHYPGSPQGRRPEEAGVHGCTLVQVDDHGQARTSLLPTDEIRYLDEQIIVDQQTTREALENLFRQRVQALVESSPRAGLLLAWTLSGSGPLMAQLRRGGLAAELLDWLRTEYGFGSPPAWSATLEVQRADAAAAQYYDQETILGDFLRAVRQAEVNSAESLQLQAYLAESHLAGGLAAVAALDDPAARDRVLAEAAWLGLELLGGAEPTPAAISKERPS
ncbi:MAG: DNA repair exonuclease [Thermoguttaceae bacterium]|jgi:DNA repair exonuclease SbcCD nuclease subunit